MFISTPCNVLSRRLPGGIATLALILILGSLSWCQAAGGPSPLPVPIKAPVPETTSWKSLRPPSKPTPDDEIVITAVGDTMIGSTFPDTTGESLPPHDAAELLAEVAPILSGSDISFGNLEGTLVDGGNSEKCRRARPGSCYAFRMPTRYGKVLRSGGFNVFGLANNHAMDFGEQGHVSTRQTLDALDIVHSGRVGDVARMLVKGKKIVLIAFAPYPAFHNLVNVSEAASLVAEMAKQADIVIVSFHAGAEGAGAQHVPAGTERFLGEDRGDVRRFTHAMIDAGAHLLIGHGPHVVRGMEVYRGRLIAYSLGNFATYGSFNLSGPNGLALILEIHLGLDGSFHGARAYPTRQEKPGGPKLDAENSILPILRELSAADFGCRAIQIADDGKISVPVDNCTPSLIPPPATTPPGVVAPHPPEPPPASVAPAPSLNTP